MVVFRGTGSIGPLAGPLIGKWLAKTSAEETLFLLRLEIVIHLCFLLLTRNYNCGAVAVSKRFPEAFGPDRRRRDANVSSGISRTCRVGFSSFSPARWFESQGDFINGPQFASPSL